MSRITRCVWTGWFASIAVCIILCIMYMTNLLWRKKNWTVLNARVGKKNSNNTLNNFSVAGIVLNRFIDVVVGGKRVCVYILLLLLLLVVMVAVVVLVVLSSSNSTYYCCYILIIILLRQEIGRKICTRIGTWKP